MNIRCMAFDTDYDRIIALWKRVPEIGLDACDSRENLHSFLTRNPRQSFICEDDTGSCIGTVLCGDDGRRGYLYHVAVDPACRRQGIGEALLLRALQALREKGIAKCHLFVFADNAPARAFYSKIGWIKRNDICVFSMPLEGPVSCC